MTARAPAGQEEARPERFSRDRLTTVSVDPWLLEQYDRFRDARPELCLGSRPHGFEWAMRQVWAHHGWDPVLGNVASVPLDRRAPKAKRDWRNPLPDGRPEGLSRGHWATVSFSASFLEQCDRFRDARPKLGLGNRPSGFDWAMRRIWAHYGWNPETGNVAPDPMALAPDAEGDWRTPLPKTSKPPAPPKPPKKR